MATFRVMISGEIAALSGQSAANREQALAAFADLFKLSLAQAETIFQRAPCLIKKGLSAESAEQYRQRLQSIGIVADIVEEEAALELSLQPIEKADKADAGTTSVEKFPNTNGNSASPYFHGDAFHGAATKTSDVGQAEAGRYDFSFYGTGAEYFRIWIVNLLLTILTFGIYGAWAKVRRLQYFYGNTEFAADRFQYLGKPKAILKGRIVAVILFALYSAAGKISPMAGLAALAALMLGYPWLIWASLRFRAANTSYRGIRFVFKGSLKSAYKILLGCFLMTVFSLGLALPAAWQWFNSYMINNMRYGKGEFSHHASVGEYFGMFIKLIMAYFGMFMAFGVLIFATLGGMFSHGKMHPEQMAASLSAGMVLVAVLVFISYIFTLVMINTLSKVFMTNLVVGRTTLAGNYFSSGYTIFSYARLQLGNIVGMIFTLGLFWPWASIRNARYRAEHISLDYTGSLDDFRADEKQELGAIGEEAADFFDMDISL